jgi:hypothetical protein
MADEVAITTAAIESAKELFSAAFDELRKAASQDKKEETRIFFPNGIELISITLDVFKVKVEFKVAGAAGIKGLLESKEIEGGLTAEVEQEVTEKQ